MQVLKPGQTLADRFELLERLTRPANGESWRARDQHSGDEVLVKVGAAVAADAQAQGTRLEQLAGLNHPSLCCSVELLWFEGHHLQIRPWIEGRTSAALETGNLDVIFTIAIRVVEGIYQAHQQQVCHGNLIPENILIDSQGRPFVVDALVGPSGTTESRADDDYSSPESKAGSPIDVRGDLYAMGALIYRWLTGRNPGRPLPESQRHEDLLKAASSDEPIPALLVSLVVDCLSADPDRRPRSGLELKERLEDARLALQRARESGFVDIEPEWQPSEPERPMPIHEDEASDHRSVVPARLMLGVALGVVTLLLISVLVILPRQIEEQREVRMAAAAMVAEQKARKKAREDALAAAQNTRPALTTADLERLLEAKQRAEETLDNIINLQFELKEKKIERWAMEAFDAADQLAKSGAEPFRNQRFEEAGRLYEQALLQLRQLEAQGEFVYLEAMERGFAALDRGDSAAADDAFGLAVALDPESESAQRGQQRAATLDQVWALLNRARELDREADWQQARTVYQQIQNLDPETAGVEAALKRIANTLADIQFREAMSEGLAALEESQWNEARAAFGAAGKMRPGSRGPADGLLEVERRFRESEIQYHRVEALARQDKEQWADALRHFEAVLEQDPNLLFAQQGQQLASDRLDLDQKLQQFLDSPERWWSDKGRQEAASLLYDARAVEQPGARLNGQIDQLGRQLQLAERPVRVQLVSDSICDVVVYKIGRLGSFESREVNLRPGRYTAVGTRNGYRDVRREFIVHTERAPQPVVVRCDEKV
jgi:tetratricopeptide (TPR) repeat protein